MGDTGAVYRFIGLDGVRCALHGHRKGVHRLGIREKVDDKVAQVGGTIAFWACWVGALARQWGCVHWGTAGVALGQVCDEAGVVSLLVC